MSVKDNMMPPLPEGFQQQMSALLGADSTEFFAGLEAPASVAVRLNRDKAGAAHTSGMPVPWCAAGFRLNERPNFTLDPRWHQGCYYVQEPASMFAAFAAKVVAADGEAPLKVLDLCAAPGGKTTAVYDAIPRGSLVVANEFMPQRAEILLENVIKWGIPDLIITRGNTAVVSKAVEGMMDLVIADVPCSGEGMMRKEAEARRQWSPALVEQCAALQREIAADGARALREGGHLIYSTCTFNARENEENVDWICENLGFEIVDLPVPKEWPLVQHGPGYHFYPHLTDSEGLYLCLLRKTSASRAARMKSPKLKMVKSADVPWMWTDGRMLVETNGSVSMISPEYAAFIGVFSKNPNTLTAGLPVAAAGKRGWEPTHAAAMSTLLRKDFFPQVEMEADPALRYLARRTDGLPEVTQRGFVCALFVGRPLGWLKGLGNRCNNLYPQNWRIRIPVP